jgi:hypothetical protein
MVKEKRKKIFNMMAAAFEGQPKYQEVVKQLPDVGTWPNAQNCPSVHIARSLEPIEPMTAMDHEARLGFELIGVVHASENLTLVQCDFEDEMEETIMSLQNDNDFLAVATLVAVTQCDPTPLSLAPLGIIKPILPPFGVVRLSGHVLFYYQAF